jgi:hypothetical protein
MFRRILVPTDGSELANQSAAAAVKFAKGEGATVIAVSILQPLASIPFYEGVGIVGAGADDLMLAQARKRADEAVEAVAALARGLSLKCETRVRDSDSISHGIVDAAKDYDCDLIFIASHGRRGLTGLLMGSVTRSVLPYAHVPVLVWRSASERAL